MIILAKIGPTEGLLKTKIVLKNLAKILNVLLNNVNGLKSYKKKELKC